LLVVGFEKESCQPSARRYSVQENVFRGAPASSRATFCLSLAREDAGAPPRRILFLEIYSNLELRTSDSEPPVNLLTVDGSLFIRKADRFSPTTDY
jgi:hypothetical protein